MLINCLQMRNLLDRMQKAKDTLSKYYFIAAVGKPHYDPHFKQSFDGTLGIYDSLLKLWQQKTKAKKDQEEQWRQNQLHL